MTAIEAVYRHGVFEPLEPVDLREEERVRLNFEARGNVSLESWLNELNALQADILKRSGPLPDSTHEIAADRMR